MRAIVAAVGFVLFGSSSFATTVPSEPSYRFAFSEFVTVAAIDSFAILSGLDGTLSAAYNSRTFKYAARDQITTTGRPWRIVFDDSLIIVVFEDRRACVLGRSALPELEVRGNIELPPSTIDLRMENGRIYLAAGFRGLMSGDILPDGKLGQLDSSQIGVHVVSIDIGGGRLVALDDYNGMLEYNISGGSPVYERGLNLPYQCLDVALMGDTVLVARADEDSMVLVTREGSDWKVDTLLTVLNGYSAAFVMDTFVVALDRQIGGFTVMDRRTLTAITWLPNVAGTSIAHPAHARVVGLTRMIVTGQSGGLLQYELDYVRTGYAPQEAYFPSGAVNSVTFIGGWLAAGGVGGWCHAFRFSDSPILDSEIVVIDQIGNVSEVQTVRQGLLILNSTLRKLNLAVSTAHGPRPSITYFFGHATSRIAWGNNVVAGRTPVFIWSGADGYFYSFNSDNSLTFESHVVVPVGIRAALLCDSTLVVSVAKIGLQGYSFGTDYRLSLRSTWPDLTETEVLLNLPSQPRRFAAIRGDQLTIGTVNFPWDFSFDSTVRVPMSALTAAVDDSLLCLTGPESTSVWYVPPDMGHLRYLGATPHGGSSVAVHDGTMVVSNGRAIRSFDLSDPTGIDYPSEILPSSTMVITNYPNPFNPSTTIAFDMPVPGIVTVDIFNTVGQRVRHLGDSFRPGGPVLIEWDGRDDRGRAVASGMYFCSITGRGVRGAAKMMLIR